MPFNLHSNVVHKFMCGRCNTTYLNVRVSEHSGVSPLTGKIQKKYKTTAAVKDHMLFYDHVVFLEDLKNLTSSNSEFYLRVKEIT